MSGAAMRGDSLRPRGDQALFTAAADVDFELADLLPQGVPVEAEELRRPQLVAPGGAEGELDERPFDLAQHAIIEPGGRQVALMGVEIVAQVALGGDA